MNRHVIDANDIAPTDKSDSRHAARPPPPVESYCAAGEGDGEGDDPGKCGGVQKPSDNAGRPADQAAQRKLGEDWKRRATQANQIAKMRGKLPGGIERLIEGIERPQVKWTEVLQQFVNTTAKNDYDSFVQQELAFRKITGYPPFSRLLRVLAEGRQESDVQKILRQACEPLNTMKNVEVLGPAPAVITKVKDNWRWHMLVKCFDQDAFDRAMSAIGTVEDLGTRTCRVTLDVDPSSLM